MILVPGCATPQRLHTTVVPPLQVASDQAPTVTLERARLLLPAAPASCANIECLLAHTYRADPGARSLALALYAETGTVAGVGEDETMAGGYRGQIRLVGQLPTARYRKHLRWVLDANRSFEEFFSALAAAGKTTIPFRWRAIELAFLRSLKKRTPSAYAIRHGSALRIAYNVAGSLMSTKASVRETMFHEIFHLNDAAHQEWSSRILRADYDAILARCPIRTRACLRVYAPNTTTVRNGTYYAFQPDNGDSVQEYAAELAVRYWKEHLELLSTRRLSKPPFKCGAPENARAWHALVNEFFAGQDLTPPCS